MLASDKLAGLGTLAAGVAHEINSPLQVITGDSESMIARLKEGEVEPKEILRRLERVNRNGWRIAHIVRSMLSYARSEQEQLAQADLNSLVSDALLLTEHQIHVWSNIEVVTELAENLPEFTCDRNKIIQVLINLLSNARDAMPNGGTVTIRTGFDPQSQRLTLTVSDTGQGIPKDLQSKIFDPFFTTKPPGQGIGLGLSVVLGIMNAHGGEIKVDSAPRQGSTFLLTFALTPPPPRERGGLIGRSLTN
jgi:two-component system NtrC family sensor kinase